MFVCYDIFYLKDYIYKCRPICFTFAGAHNVPSQNFAQGINRLNLILL